MGTKVQRKGVTQGITSKDLEPDETTLRGAGGWLTEQPGPAQRLSARGQPRLEMALNARHWVWDLTKPAFIDQLL